MNYITLTEGRRRTGIELIPDTRVYCRDVLGRLMTVREAQRIMERRYPRHKRIRLISHKHFAARGYELYPYGVTAGEVRSCPDFAILCGSRLVFIECLTAFWTRQEKLKQKAAVDQFAPIWFIIEDAHKNNFPRAQDFYNYLRRVRRLAGTYQLWLCDVNSSTLRKIRIN